MSARLPLEPHPNNVRDRLQVVTAIVRLSCEFDVISVSARSFNIDYMSQCMLYWLYDLHLPLINHGHQVPLLAFYLAGFLAPSFSINNVLFGWNILVGILPKTIHRYGLGTR